MPNYAKFLKDMVTRKKRIEEFETAAATETCLALMHNKIPAKKTDPGSFTIECFIGHNYPTKALCDHGASINLTLKSVFSKTRHRRGKAHNSDVAAGRSLIYENAPIILGRPFLSTSRAMIDFDKDEIVFKVDSDQVKMKALTKQLEQKKKGKGINITPPTDTQRPKLYLGAHVERDKGVMSLRDA
ncbi:hypothetical protein V6N13_006218 [Hibiscus sabdariffa]